MKNFFDFESLGGEYKLLYESIRAGKTCSVFGVESNEKLALLAGISGCGLYIVPDQMAGAKAKEILESPMFVEQKGIRSLVDKDARVGHKSQTESFFGYKAEYCQTIDGELITAVKVENGAYMDGTNFEELISRSEKAGINIIRIFPLEIVLQDFAAIFRCCNSQYSL